ncbi:myophilin-like [Hydractinia symbiolongicarpus]|uniref:myophilin-like n=1 Tax=Hydractinia symbiolongicarpus TaxID=13093 RepID=UPI00254DAEF6|nr:myophilin-like [Hydractinia symbiolongicarpus]
MSNSAEMRRRIAAKYDVEMEKAVLDWMAGVLEDTKLFHNVSGPQSLHDKLKDGVILCKLMNKIKPGSIKKYSHKPIAPFQKMENISFFNQAMREYNVKPDYVFVTADLFQKKNMVQVLIGLRALGTRATEEGVKPEISI